MDSALVNLVIWPCGILLTAFSLRLGWFCIRQRRWIELVRLCSYLLLLVLVVDDVVIEYVPGDPMWRVVVVGVAFVLEFVWVVAHVRWPARYWPSKKWMRVPRASDRRRHRVDAPANSVVGSGRRP